jgi:hypothetical protein
VWKTFSYVNYKHGLGAKSWGCIRQEYSISTLVFLMISLKILVSRRKMFNSEVCHRILRSDGQYAYVIIKRSGVRFLSRSWLSWLRVFVVFPSLSRKILEWYVASFNILFNHCSESIINNQCSRSRDSLVSIENRLRVGRPGFNSQRGKSGIHPASYI